MSQLLQAAALLDAIKQDCIDAWELTGRVHFGEERIPDSGRPYAVINLQPVAMDFQTANAVEQTYSFIITAKFDFPATGNILLTKITQANLLIARIITGPNYNDIAYLPIIREVNFDEADDPQRQSYEFSVTFECKVSENHH